MQSYICVTCGTQYPPSVEPPAECLICLDERQYIGHNGQQWTSMSGIAAHHHNEFREIESGLTAIVSEPRFAIGQRALLIQTPHGNTLWDCITLLDDQTIEHIRALGGIKQIAISHPHFYTSMIEWSRAFDAPIYIHEADRHYVARPDSAVHFWQGESHSLGDDITLIRCGGHFEGSQVLHWPAVDGKGVLLTGDTMMVVSDRRYVTFMYSYPNIIPLSPAKIRKIQRALSPYAFDRLYDAFRFDLQVTDSAKASVEASAERYIAAITD